MDRRGDKWKALYLERILAAYELSSAFAHVHEQKLVYRDCKAENVAFDLVRRRSYGSEGRKRSTKLV